MMPPPARSTRTDPLFPYTTRFRSDYLGAKESDIAAWNAAGPERARDAVNARRITNIGTFRAYMTAYLKDRGDMAEGMLLVVRQLAPTETGLPLEIYAYTANTSWSVHADVQGDIFDHLISILPEFGLRLFKPPTGLAFSPYGAAAMRQYSMRLQPVQPGVHRRRGLPGARDRAHPREVPDVARRIAEQIAERAAEMGRAREPMGIGEVGDAAPIARRA